MDKKTNNKIIRWTSGAIVLIVVALAGLILGQPRISSEDHPNIIFILTDDLDFPLMPYMENTNSLIRDQGATFTNYFVTSSACCPSRSSTLRGQYPHNTGDLDRESSVIAYRGVRTEKFIYIEYESAELEFYDLINDPFEMDNLAGSLSEETLFMLHAWLAHLKTCKAEECRAIEMALPEIKMLNESNLY